MSTPQDDDAPISLKALDAVRRCAETEMRRRLEDPSTEPSSSKRARVDDDTKGNQDEDHDDTKAGGDGKFREVARFGYAAVDALYGDGDGGGGASSTAFLATCDLRHEKSAIREAERLLLGSEEKRLTPVKLACRGVALLLSPSTDATTPAAAAAASLAAADRVLAAVDGGASPRPRFCHRIQPVAATCSAVDPDAVARAAKRVCEEAAETAAATTTTTTKFSVVFKARHDGVGAPSGAGSLRSSVIKSVAAAMEAAFSSSKGEQQGGKGEGEGKGGAAVDLRRPDVVLFADVLPVTARPKEPLLVLSAVPARMCALGSSNTHFRGLAAAAGTGAGGGAAAAGTAAGGGKKKGGGGGGATAAAKGGGAGGGGGAGDGGGGDEEKKEARADAAARAPSQ
jgi:hypothetical protein